jgi:UDP-N-acetylglucosamine 2-epimerase (non-hydrolysing)
MDRVFFEQLELPDAKYNLEVGSGTHAEQTGKMLMGIERTIQSEMPDVVLVQGDTNTTLAGALAATKLGIEVGHVEAGLRSYDRSMPEEINRVLADHCCDLLFAPTEKCRQILLHEGIPEDKIFVTGNTIVDAVYQNLEISRKRGNVLNHLGINSDEYFLATVHRQENVDDEKRFRSIIRGLEIVEDEFEVPIVYPIHPRAEKQLKVFNIEVNGLRLIPPVDYLSFLQLESNARLVFTDSGGVQEETCILGIPCVTLRYNTERPETLEVGANTLAGTDPYEILKKADHMLNGKNSWSNPFGDGKAGKRIIQILREKFE